MIIIENRKNTKLSVPDMALPVYRTHAGDIEEWDLLYIIPDGTESDRSYAELLGWASYKVDENRVIHVDIDFIVQIVFYKGRYFTHDKNYSFNEMLAYEYFQRENL